MGLGNEPALPKLLIATPPLALSPSAVFWQRGVPGFGWESPGAGFPRTKSRVRPSHTWHAKMIFLTEPEAALVHGLTPNCEVI